METKPKHRGTAWFAAGTLLIAAACVLVLGNLWEDRQAGRAAAHAMDSLRKLVISETATAMAALPTGETPVGEPYETEVPDYILNPGMPMPEEVVNGRSYIGILSIPAADMELPIQSAWSYPNLKATPCRYTGSVYTDDMIIAGHDYRTHFRALRDLTGGERVTFTDADGNVFAYNVSLIETIGGNDVEGLTGGDWDLTLFTCTADGASRVVIRCNGAGSM